MKIEWFVTIVCLLLFGLLWTTLAVLTSHAYIGFLGLAILYRKLNKILQNEGVRTR